MATKCPNCGAFETQSMLDRDQCLICGQQFNADGKLAAGPDQATRDEIMRNLAPRQTNVVGNLADLQRGGALVVTGESNSVADGVVAPPGTSTEQLQAEASANEKVADALAAASDSVADAQAVAAGGDQVTTTKSSKSDKK